MKLEGEYRFDATIQQVWDALFDTAVLAAALPGCEKLDLVDGVLVGEMTIKIGPISGKFTGKVTLEDKVEPTRYTMIIDGRGPQGFVKATAPIELTADGDGTKIHYTADAQIGGKIASVGQRLVDASARAITKQSLDNLHENIKLRAAHRAPPAEPLPPPPAETPATGDAASVEPAKPAAEPASAAPAYKRAEASEMAKAVAKEVGKTLLPWILLVVAVIVLVVWWLVR